ncbi:uncharacterized protein [Bemisia tabaci]|uniref:uncharacterized protein isoform X1 n=1 Tax=Bemisia tabaci TaxID=7038 RepID=UPI003B282493
MFPFPIVLLCFGAVALAAERSPEAHGRQVVLTQLILPNGQYPGPAKVIEAAAPLPARQVSYTIPQLKPNYVDGFQYYPVFPGQAPVPYGASPFVYYQPGAPYPAYVRDEQGSGGGGWSNFFSNWQNYIPSSIYPQGGQSGQSEEQQSEENGEEDKQKPQKVQQQIQQQQLQQQQFQQQQEQLQQQQIQQVQQQIKLQQEQLQQQQPSQVFYNQQPAPESVGNQKDGAPAGLQNPAATAQFPQFLYGAQPQFFGPYPSQNRVSQDPDKLTAASHGAVSNYLFLKNQQQPAFQHTQQRYESPAAEPAPLAAGGRGRPAAAAAPGKRLELERYSADAKNQRSPLYAQHVSALQVSADPASIQGHLIAQASPEALAAAGQGGMAGAGPTGQAIVGDRGLALSAPKSTAIAGHPDIEVVITGDKKPGSKPKKPVAKYSKSKGYHIDYSS